MGRHVRSMEDFDQRHSAHGQPLPHPEKNLLMFETGARRTNHGYPAHCEYEEPSASDVERIQARIDYYRERVRRAEKAHKAETERLRHEALDRHMRGIEHTGLHGEDALRYGRTNRELEISQRRLRELLNEYAELPIIRQIANQQRATASFKF